jgi:hypothetical protein
VALFRVETIAVFDGGRLANLIGQFFAARPFGEHG